jgi:hypothetical protein
MPAASPGTGTNTILSKSDPNTHETQSCHLVDRIAESGYLENFTPINPNELNKLRRVKISRAVDGINTALFKRLWEHFPDLLTAIFNSSLKKGVVPSCFKTALFPPIIKSQSLDIQELKSYRPVSNLLLSKVLETAVAHQLNKHFNDFLGSCQSAYRMGMVLRQL